VIALGLGCGVGPAVVRAGTGAPSPEVQWTGPDECASVAFTDALDRLLAGSPLDVSLRVRAKVERSEDGWSIHTDFDAGPGRVGRRTFQASSCRTVAHAAALAIAIAVDPNVLDRWVPPAAAEVAEAPIAESPALGASGPGPVEVRGTGSALTAQAASASPPPEPSPPLGPIEAVSPAPAADRGRDPASRWRGLLGAWGSVDGGALPGPGLGLAVVTGVLHRRFRGEAVGQYRFATEKASTVDPLVGGSFTQWAVGARGCGVSPVGTVELPLCLGFEGGRTIGRGLGLPAARTSAQPWLAGLVEAGLAWPVRPWLALTARATLSVPVLRQTFSVTGLGVVHRVGAIQGRGALGVELRWP
jgi:hypothetical protein